MQQAASLDRRDFLQLSALSGAGLLLGFYLPRAAASPAASAGAAFQPNAFLRIGADDTVTVWVPKSEMGQGVLTSLPMVLAEELEVDLAAIRIEQAGAAADDRYGPQITGGSTSIRTTWEPLRRAGATARELLIAAAAEQWRVARSECEARQGAVVHSGSGRKLSYGALAAAAARRPPPEPERIQLKNPRDFRLIGRRVHRIQAPALADGSARFGLDVRLPGMLHAAVVHCPTFGGQVAGFDPAPALALPGVRRVIEIERRVEPILVPSGVAVIAESTWAASQGAQALQIDWDGGPAAAEGSAALRAQFERLAASGGKVVREDGDAAAALAAAATRIEAVYELPYQAHAPMEPMNCVARVEKDRCEIWSGTQDPQRAQKAAAAVLGIPEPSVTVHVPLLGGAFGRRHYPDVVVEAVLLSKAAGAPVKLTWSREQDMQHGFFRPATYQRLQGGVDDEGKPVAWIQHILNVRNNQFTDEDFPAHAIANYRLEYSHVPQAAPHGWWRSVEYSNNTFVIQSFVDELAAAGGKDPVALRLELLGPLRRLPYYDGIYDTGRLRHVIQLAAEKASWGEALPQRRGRGIAAQFAFEAYIAQVAEVEVQPDGTVRVHRVVCAIDCGLPVTPNLIEAQVEGGIAYGLSATLHGEITIERGRVQQSNFHDFPLLRLDQMPKVEVHIVPSNEPPAGAGEPPVPPIAAAVANAIFQATGKRVRRLPIRSADLKT